MNRTMGLLLAPALLLALPAEAFLRPLARPADLVIPEDPLVPVAAAAQGALPPPAAVATGAIGAATDASLGPETNLPLPRYVSLKTDEGNARRGPSLDYRIDWVFVREDMPLRLTAEHGHWRRVEDRDGVGGWIHYSLLSGTRTAIVDEDLPLRARPEEDAVETAIVEEGVVAGLESCEGGWCRVSAGGYGGWVPSHALWGVAEGEVLD